MLSKLVLRAVIKACKQYLFTVPPVMADFTNPCLDAMSDQSEKLKITLYIFCKIFQVNCKLLQLLQSLLTALGPPIQEVILPIGGKFKRLDI